MFRIKSKTLRIVVISQIAIVFLFLAMTISNEILDLPHYIFGDKPTSFDQRTGEIVIELVILAIIITVEMLLINKFYQRIKILEGFLPICANCKRIRRPASNPRKKEYWQTIETYLSEKTTTKFSHSICPECAKILYPDLDIREH